MYNEKTRLYGALKNPWYLKSEKDVSMQKVLKLDFMLERMVSISIFNAFGFGWVSK